VREKLWNLLDKTRFEYNYFQEYRQHLERIRIAVVVLTSAVMLTVISLSLTIDVNPTLWNLLLLASGLAALVFEKLLISDKLSALKYFIPELNAHLDEMQMEWIMVNEQDGYDDEAIVDLFTSRVSVLSKLSEKYLDNLNFSEHKKSVNRASEVTRLWAEKLS